jgi:RNA polymerase sigma factor (TIGR02999 family)
MSDSHPASDLQDPSAAHDLLPLVYAELRKLAEIRLQNEKPGQTLQATALVHEVWLRLAGSGHQAQLWNHKGHFFAAAAESMRRILVENARRKKRLKRSSGGVRVDLDSIIASDVREDLLALDAALAKLEQIKPRSAELVKLKYFAGLTFEEAAQSLGMSLRTAERSWSYARAWLRCEMEKALEIDDPLPSDVTDLQTSGEHRG